MIFNFVKCPKCNNRGFIPDDELTIDSYFEDYKKSVSLLIPQTEVLFYPNYVICKCSNVKCNFIEKIDNGRALELLRHSYAEIAWLMFQQENQNKQGFDGYFTSYLYERGIDKFISSVDYIKNPWLKEVIDYLRKEDEKLTK